MNEDEVIVVDGIPDDAYRSIVEESLRYAILSLAFTVNRMALNSLKSRLINIAKGKIAEKLFFFFARRNAIPLDTTPCRTPFYQVDRRDFILNDLEWDIKNNFLFHSGDLLPDFYTHLPALVPDRNSRDQWAKRYEKQIPASKGVAFLFTFMKLSDRRGNSFPRFFDLELSKAQLDLLHRAHSKYRGKAQTKAPFREEVFWKEWQKSNERKTIDFKINNFPALIITAYATENEFNRFQPLPEDRMFVNGALHTRIRNRSVPVKELPSFASLFPHLRENLQVAHFRDFPTVSEM